MTYTEKKRIIRNHPATSISRYWQASTYRNGEWNLRTTNGGLIHNYWTADAYLLGNMTEDEAVFHG